MRKLIQIQLTTAVQFQPPLGVQKIVATKVGPVAKADLVELPNGDVEVHVIGKKYNHFHLVHRESIVQKLYEQEQIAEVIDLTQPQTDPAKETIELKAEHIKPEHWKTRQKREKLEAEAAAKAGT